MSDQLRLYFLLMPGVITLGIASLIGAVPDTSGVTQIVLLLFFSIVNLAVALVCTQFFLRAIGAARSLSEISRNGFFLSGLLLVSVSSGFVLALAYENAWLNRGAQVVVGSESGVLTKQSNLALLHELVLNSFGTSTPFPDSRDPNTYSPGEHSTFLVHASLKGSDDAVVGYRSRWEGGVEVSAIYLTPACVLRGDTAIPVDGAGVYVRVPDIEYISFVDEGSPVAKCAYRLRAGGASTAP